MAKDFELFSVVCWACGALCTVAVLGVEPF